MIDCTQKIKPVGDRILLQRHKVTEQISNGVFIPDSAKEKPQEATVIAIGSGRKTDKGVRIPTELKVGDSVIIDQYAGSEVTLGEITYTLMREDDVLGILSDIAIEASS